MEFFEYEGLCVVSDHDTLEYYQKQKPFLTPEYIHNIQSKVQSSWAAMQL